MDSEEIEVVPDKAEQDKTFKLGEIPAAAASQARLRIAFREKSQSRLLISLGEKIEIAEPVRTSRNNVCIYKVHRGIRDVNYKAYDPRILSIGPYHRGKKRLTDMDQHKRRCLDQVLKRTNQDANLYLDSIREIEEHARSCYDEPIDLTSDQFVEMMVLDGCFLLELFQGCSRDFEELGYSHDDPVFGIRGPWVLIFGDIIKLENQLPLSILEKLLELQIGKSYKQCSLISAILRFMEMDETMYNPLLSKFKNCLHCLHILRESLLPPVDHKSQDRQKHRFIDFMTKLRRARRLIRFPSRSRETVSQSIQKISPSVTKIREAGIILTTRESNCFHDIKFEDGVLKMPRLFFESDIKCQFPNLIAFEQCHRDCGKDITSYALFLDNLIDTAEDVDYLHKCGILVLNGEKYDEVADFFNHLCDQVSITGYESYPWDIADKLIEEVERYYNNNWIYWWVNMKRTYFSNPWSIISLIAAIVLVVLTFLQTFYGMYAYYRPR